MTFSIRISSIRISISNLQSLC